MNHTKPIKKPPLHDQKMKADFANISAEWDPNKTKLSWDSYKKIYYDCLPASW